MLYLKGALSSGYARYDVALCLISMTEPVGGGINEMQSHGEADSPRAYSVNVAASPSVGRELLRITPTPTHQRSDIARRKLQTLDRKACWIKGTHTDRMRV